MSRAACRLSLLSLLSMLLFVASPLFAQFETSTVLGTIKDETGGAAPGVTVTLTSLDTGITQSKVTDGQGNYEFFTVRIGNYRLTAELQGFQPAKVEQLRVTV